MNKKNENENEKKLMGVTIKTWCIATLIVLGILLLIFIIIPYVLSTWMPILRPNEEYTYLVDSIDGAALVVGIVGSVASGISIIMTFSDRTRYNQEKQQTEKLFTSVNTLHGELSIVNEYVTKTFEQNKKLALELYSNEIIKSNPNNGIEISNPSTYQSNDWENQQNSGEINE